LSSTGTRLSKTRDALNDLDVAGLGYDSRGWLTALAALKAIAGNTSNDVSFVACLLAKAFLLQRYSVTTFDVAEKAQGAQGLDIDIMTRDGQRIVAQVKTTTPYKPHDFGAQQWHTIKRDFQKLESHKVTISISSLLARYPKNARPRNTLSQ